MEPKGVSKAFMTFLQETPEYSKPWMEMVQQFDIANALDKKTMELAYISVLAAAGMTSGIPFHVQQAKAARASREEILGAVLVGLLAVGLGVVQALPAAITAYDEK